MTPPRPEGWEAAQPALRAALRASTRTHGEACPPLDDIERALAGELAGQAQARVAQALAECADCAALARLSTQVAMAAAQAQWQAAAIASADATASTGRAQVATDEITLRAPASRLRDVGPALAARHLGHAALPADEIPGASPRRMRIERRRAFARRGWPWAVAAASMIAVGLGALLPVLRDTPEGGARDGVAVEAAVLPVPGATLDAPPLELRWPPESGAAGYIVEVFGAADEPVWNSATLTGARAVPDAIARRRLQRGDFSWRVQVLGGEQARALGPWRFSVRGQ